MDESISDPAAAKVTARFRRTHELFARYPVMSTTSPRVAASAPAQTSDLNGSFVKTIMTKHIYASGNRSGIIFLLQNLVKHEV